MRGLLGSIPIALLAACTQGNSEPRTNAVQSTRNFATGAFETVALEGPDNVRVVRGPRASVVASGRTDVLDRLDIRVERGTLKIGRKRMKGWRVDWSDDKGATIVVTTPVMRGATLAGSGDMNVDRGEARDFAAAVAGSGDLSIGAISAQHADLSVTGSGELRIAGRADRIDLSVSGSGDADASRLAASTASVSLTGSGSARVAARQSATVSIAGSGDVDIAGTRNCQIAKSGSGEARCTG
jgi:DNA-binding transcriptional regulator YdaS (Cro superfamily)